MAKSDSTLAATSAEEEIKSRQHRKARERAAREGVEGTAAKEELSGGEVGSGGGQRTASRRR